MTSGNNYVLIKWDHSPQIFSSDANHLTGDQNIFLITASHISRYFVHALTWSKRGENGDISSPSNRCAFSCVFLTSRKHVLCLHVDWKRGDVPFPPSPSSRWLLLDNCRDRFMAFSLAILRNVPSSCFTCRSFHFHDCHVFSLSERLNSPASSLVFNGLLTLTTNQM